MSSTCRRCRASPDRTGRAEWRRGVGQSAGVCVCVGSALAAGGGGTAGGMPARQLLMAAAYTRQAQTQGPFTRLPPVPRHTSYKIPLMTPLDRLRQQLPPAQRRHTLHPARPTWPARRALTTRGVASSKQPAPTANRPNQPPPPHPKCSTSSSSGLASSTASWRGRPGLAACGRCARLVSSASTPATSALLSPGWTACGCNVLGRWV